MRPLLALVARTSWRARGAAAAGAAGAAWLAASAPEAEADCKARAASTTSLSEPGLELLVHNISHADMVLAVRESLPEGADGAAEPQRIFSARPQFNSYQPISRGILRQLEAVVASGAAIGVATSTSKYCMTYSSGLDLTATPVTEQFQQSGPDRPPGAAALSPWAPFHLRGEKKPSQTVEEGEERPTRPKQLYSPGSVPEIVRVYFPLLAVVIPEWIRAIKRRALAQEGAPPPKKVLVLVSGAGQPRDELAKPADNSTEATGQIIERFVRLVHPDIEVVHIPSAFGIFRYDDNVRFVKEQVLPIIEAKRAEVVSMHRGEWSSRLKVTVCLADGAPARISAINAAMRSYRPDYLHVWRTKTFWDTGCLSEEDVESHTFKKLEMRPAIHRSQLTVSNERALIDEMIRYKRQFEAVRDSDKHELDSFWLRKTGKAVLAVLLTQREDGSLFFTRGLNVEVSMPTGTLCAERNAIGNALAADQSISRRDMQAVAVLSVSLAEEKRDTAADGAGGGMIELRGAGDASAKRRKATEEDLEAEVVLNPLDPCGACMEWLKKIAEVNPDFKVLTFTSTSCEKVFITPIGDYG